MVAVKFPRSNGQTGVRLEGGAHSPFNPGYHGGRTGGERGSWEKGREKGGHCLVNRDTHKWKRGRGGSDDLFLYRWAPLLLGLSSCTLLES